MIETKKKICYAEQIEKVNKTKYRKCYLAKKLLQFTP